MSGGRCAAVYIDMTESHRRATEFEALQGKIQAANRTKSVFLAKLSHAMRTPLTGILGMAQILADGRLAPDDREQVEIILESGNILIALLEEALNLSQIEAGQMQFHSNQRRSRTDN
jgi:signal transduction histidine kinase